MWKGPTRALTSGPTRFHPLKKNQLLGALVGWGSLQENVLYVCGWGRSQCLTWSAPLQEQLPIPQPYLPGACKPAAFWESEHLFLGSSWGAVAYCFPQPRWTMTMTEEVLTLVLMAYHWRVSWRGCSVLVSGYQVGSKSVAVLLWESITLQGLCYQIWFPATMLMVLKTALSLVHRV